MLADRTANGGQPVDELGGVVVVAAPDADGPAAQNSQRRLITN
jgi:hypothetical protein